jgi:formate dehydrogenase alpha subunit
MGDLKQKYRMVPTICVYCGTGCGMLLEVSGGKVTGVLPDKDHPVSQGKLCIKGWNCHQFIYSEKRLTVPLVRQGGGMVEVSWKRAISETASRLRRISEEYGGDSLAFISSARCTNEENYLFQKLARSFFKNNNIDHCARL